MFTVGNQYPVQELTEEVFKTLAPKGLILAFPNGNFIFYYKNKFSYVSTEGFDIDKIIININTNRYIPRVEIMYGAWDYFTDPRNKFIVKQLKRPSLQKTRYVNT